MAERALPNPPRLVGVAGTDDAVAAALAVGLAASMAGTGARVCLGSVDTRRHAVLTAAGACAPLAVAPSEAGDPRTGLSAAIEAAGAGHDRIVIDLGRGDTPDSLFFGAAADDLLLVLAADAGAARRAAPYVTALRRRWARDEVGLVVTGAAGAAEAMAIARALVDAVGADGPRLIPFGTVGALPDLGAARLATAAAGTPGIDAIAAEILVARPFLLRGGVQFFLGAGVAHARVA